jgi:hypothetical protein
LASPIHGDQASGTPTANPPQEQQAKQQPNGSQRPETIPWGRVEQAATNTAVLLLGLQRGLHWPWLKAYTNLAGVWYTKLVALQ